MLEPVTFLIGGTAIAGWTEVKITRTMSDLCHSFSLSLAGGAGIAEAMGEVRASAPCQVKIGSDLVVSGYLGKPKITIEADRFSVALEGRSKPADLVDSSFLPDDGEVVNFGKTRLSAVLRRLVRGFGIPVTMRSADVEIDSFATQEGEKVFDAMDRACKKANRFMMSSPSGGIWVAAGPFGRMGSVSVPGNAVSFTSGRDFTNLHSVYQVRAKGTGTSLDQAFGNTASEKRDGTIGRYRPLVISFSGSGKESSERAALEASVRASKSIQMSAIVPGWRDENGALWQPNNLTPISVPRLGIRREMLITEASFSLSDRQMPMTSLSFLGREAFNPTYRAFQERGAGLLSEILERLDLESGGPDARR